MIGKIRNKIKSKLTQRQVKKLKEYLKPEEKDLIGDLRSKGLTYLSERKLIGIVNSCNEIREANLPGIFVEAGCALGGTPILISKQKTKERPFQVYDVFGMIPPPTKEDTEDVHDRYQTIVEGKSEGLNGNKYYGYEENLYEKVQANLKSFGVDCQKENVSLIKGLVQDTMKINEPVAFAHIDVDWYDPVKTCLEQIFPNLVVGGCIVLDDYYDWGGCRKAADEYLRQIVGQFSLDDSYGSMKIIRVK